MPKLSNKGATAPGTSTSAAIKNGSKGPNKQVPSAPAKPKTTAPPSAASAAQASAAPAEPVAQEQAPAQPAAPPAPASVKTEALPKRKVLYPDLEVNGVKLNPDKLKVSVSVMKKILGWETESEWAERV